MNNINSITFGDKKTRTDIARLLNATKDKRFNLDKPLVHLYIDLLTDLSYVIECIQKGYGCAKRAENENPEAVLEELREELNYEFVTDRILPLLYIAEFEDCNDRFISLMTDIVGV